MKAYAVRLNVHREDGLILVDLIGQVTTSEAHFLQSQLDELIRHEESTMFFNCKDLRFISSAGLRVFLNLAKQASATNKKLGIYSLNSTVSQVFEISGFNQIIKIYKDEDEAKASI